ncbi:hypothetical protein SAMN06296065_12024 [Novosphingobium panipatense]|uniref:Uncharacterized protein n=1 Tax=Novosphingobium panipatense TaxID=428991 RepID=A0ABY1QVY5_9SPHN|nr:hypothetical protein SAMN06296065_12024 [Novosphingobium panipatense]
MRGASLPKLIEARKREPEGGFVRSSVMERCSNKRPLALVVASARNEVAWQLVALRQRGYEVRFVDNPWDALALFGEDIPEIAVLGPLRRTPCLDLLIDDLERYGVPVTRTQGRHGRQRREHLHIQSGSRTTARHRA